MQSEGDFAGYACVFNAVDRGRDKVLPGAFARSLGDRGARGIKVLWQHDPSEPIGVLDSVYEDARGLYVRGRLLLDIGRAREALSLMRAAALDGLSIGYRTVLSHREGNVRVLSEVDLWEVSLVTFPMQDGARVLNFKTAAPGSGWGTVVASLDQLRARLMAA